MKLSFTLRDMLFRLHGLVQHECKTVHRLQVVGVLNTGLSFQMMRMINPAGYVTVLQRVKRLEVPDSITGIRKIFVLLVVVAQMKVCVCGLLLSVLADSGDSKSLSTAWKW